MSLVLLFWAAAQATGDALPCDLTVHPDRIEKQSFKAQHQQAFADPTRPDPAPFTDTPNLATYPNRLERRYLATWHQQAYTAPVPLPGSPDAYADAFYPAALPRPRAAQQTAYWAPPLDVAAPSTVPAAVYPDIIRRVRGAITSGLIAPPATDAAFDLTVHPDRAPRRSLHASQHQAFVRPFDPGPATIDLTIHPDRIPRRYLSVTQQQAYTGPITPGNVVPPTPFVDIIWRGGVSVASSRDEATVHTGIVQGVSVATPPRVDGVVVNSKLGVAVVTNPRETGVRVRGKS